VSARPQIGVHRGIDEPLRRIRCCLRHPVQRLEHLVWQAGVRDDGALLGIGQRELEIRRVPSGPAPSGRLIRSRRVRLLLDIGPSFAVTLAGVITRKSQRGKPKLTP
jgi:hypothetical protein